MSKESKSQLSDEFKKDISENGSKGNILGALIAIMAIVLVFGTVGVAGYELIFKPEKIQQKSSDEKIVSRPEETQETPKPEVDTPVEPVVETPKVTTETPVAVDYVVVSGDSYSSIANANGMSSADLMKYNNATTEDLQIGQTIKIPKK